MNQPQHPSPSDDLQFHSVDPDQLQRITVDDVETGNLFPDLVLDDTVPVSPQVLQVKPGMTREALFMLEATAVLAIQTDGGLNFGSHLGLGNA